LGGDNKIVTNIDNFRTVLSNYTLLIHPFKPPSYRQVKLLLPLYLKQKIKICCENRMCIQQNTNALHPIQ
jgi:hypothetical protein